MPSTNLVPTHVRYSLNAVVYVSLAVGIVVEEVKGIRRTRIGLVERATG